eukprot:COSAG02_NODE_141_length_34311_cov_54.733135_28_plen_129_part_00
MTACCAVGENDCTTYPDQCLDHTSAGNWLFGLEPGPPVRFGTTGKNSLYQVVDNRSWPVWGRGKLVNGLPINDLQLGMQGVGLGVGGCCDQGSTYAGTEKQICGGNFDVSWGKTNMETWYPATSKRQE